MADTNIIYFLPQNNIIEVFWFLISISPAFLSLIIWYSTVVYNWHHPYDRHSSAFYSIILDLVIFIEFLKPNDYNNFGCFNIYTNHNNLLWPNFDRVEAYITCNQLVNALPQVSNSDNQGFFSKFFCYQKRL